MAPSTKRSWVFFSAVAVCCTFVAIFGVWEVRLHSYSSQQATAVTSVTSWDQLAPVPAAPASAGIPYIEIQDSCNYAYVGTCVNLRSGPGTTYPVAMQLRNNMVFRVASTTVNSDGHIWYEVGFDGPIRYPERVTSNWYVAADYTRFFYDPGPLSTTAGVNASSTKRIVVDRTNEMLYAYDGTTLFMQQAISVGLELTPTPTGNFYIYRKIPDAYMQGPIPGLSDQSYDLPGVPWDLYFTKDGAAIHGAYWHNHFGEPWSHGCVNLPPAAAEILYEWADLGTPVTVVG